MKTFTTYKISDNDIDLTVEQYLKQVLNFSGRKLQQLTRQKGIKLNGRPVYLQRKLRAKDILQILMQEDTNYGLMPEPGDIDILYEDEYLIIINKPEHLLVHPAGQTKSGTLANYLAYYLQQQGIVSLIRPLHRLDRGTSGCVIFAKDAHSQFTLEQQLKSRSLKRLYNAIIEGIATPPSGTINAPIGIDPNRPNRRIVDKNGEPAVTHYQTISSYGNASLLELSLDTGRTHQIRVHLAYLGHPIIGDAMYGKRSPIIARQALHAGSVTFLHLKDGRKVTVTAPLPADIDAAINYFNTKTNSL